MRRFLAYVLVFFGVCYLLSSISPKLNEKIMKNNTKGMVKELSARIKQGEQVYMGGQTLVAYMLESNSLEPTYKGLKTNWYDMNVPTSNENTYKVYMENGELDVTEANGHEETALMSIDEVAHKVLIKNIFINIVGLLTGVALYVIYNKRNSMYDENVESVTVF
jgi:hypothetical protein